MPRELTGRRRAALPYLCLPILGAVACGGSPSSPSNNAECESGVCTDASAVDAAKDDEGLVAVHVDAGNTSDAGAVALCSADAGPDVPDDSFADTNCDGIDGDKGHAVFVAPSGSDAASGAFGSPVATIGKGLDLAIAQHKDVYVCDATYSEAVEVTQGVGIYGGYDCAHGWQRIDDVFTLAPTGGPRPEGTAPDAGADDAGASIAPMPHVPLVVRSVAQAVTIDHAKMLAPDAVTPGDSAIASFVTNSANVSFHHVILQAGPGADGAQGNTVPAVTAPATQGGPGESGAMAWQCAQSTIGPNAPAGCYDSVVVPSGGQSFNFPTCEGVAGAGASSRKAAGSGQPAGVGGAGENDTIYPNVAAQPGKPGAKGAPGIASQGPVGTFDESGYQPTNAGSDGTAGGPGGGGGGGGVDTRPTCEQGLLTAPIWAAGGGGEGGYGGCGGSGGRGGGGGGASIGLLSIRSAIALSTATVSTSSGGAGGAPSAGGSGQAGGQGGAGGEDLASVECAQTSVALTPGARGGAPGGAGGQGGAGGPGAGGPSMGLVSVGTVPRTEAVAFNIGPGGQGGAAIAASQSGSGTPSDGADGESGATLAIDAPATLVDAGNDGP